MVITTRHAEAMEAATPTAARTGRTTETEARRTGALSTAGSPSRGQDNTEVGARTAGDRDTTTGDRHKLKWTFYWTFDTSDLNFGINCSVSILKLLQLRGQAACLHPRRPFLRILFPLWPQREVIRHVLVPEVQVLVAPDAGGERGGEHQVRDVCLLPAELSGGAHGEHPVQPRACGDRHQLIVDIVLVVIRKREAAVRNKVE